MPSARISREVDGERVEGVTRPVFIRNGGDYFLTELEIYADGSIWCWEWVDLAGLKAKLATGWVATSFEPGARASVHHLGSWRFADPLPGIEPDWLLDPPSDAGHGRRLHSDRRNVSSTRPAASRALPRLPATRQMRMSTSGMPMYKYALDGAWSCGYRAVSSSHRS